MRVVLAGGGTGGHLFPAVALAEELRREQPQAQVLFVGTPRGIEARVLPKLGWPLEFVDMAGFVGKGLVQKLTLAPRLVKSVSGARAILKRFRPQLVVGVGGYASVPTVIAARTLGLPTLIHEQNALPGLANRLLGPLVDRVCLSFAEAAQAFDSAKTVVTGNPVRRELAQCPPLANGRPRLLVCGGSRGARAINQAMVAALSELEPLRGKIDILHQSGEEDLEATRAGYTHAGWDGDSVVAFIDDMATAYREAQLVLCRAGATTLAELTACGRGAILVPFPHAAGDHQSANARLLTERGAAMLLPQSELGARLGPLLMEILPDHGLLSSMAGAAHALGRRDAAAALLRECQQLVAARARGGAN